MSDDQTAALRLPPQSVEAEAAVLGGLLLDNTAWDRIGDLLRDTDFYRADHRLIYAAISRLVEQARPADAVTVYEHLQSIGKAEDAGGLSYINSLAQETPSASNIRRYAEIVRDRSILRRLVSVSDTIATITSKTSAIQGMRVIPCQSSNWPATMTVTIKPTEPQSRRRP